MKDFFFSSSQPLPLRSQRGVASVEFALIGMIMVILLMGMFVWWRTFQAHQSLTRAAGDGARIAHSLITAGKQYPCVVSNADENQEKIEKQVKDVILYSLKQSGMPGDTDANFIFSPHPWSCSPGSFSFDLTYNIPPIFGGLEGFSEPKKITEYGIINFNALASTP